MGTLSKALGSAGGFVAGSRALIDWLCEPRPPLRLFDGPSPRRRRRRDRRARHHPRRTPPPHRTLDQRRPPPRTLAPRFPSAASAAGQIIPLVIGSAEATMQLAAYLRRHGFFVPAIRPPSVPEGQSLLARFSLAVGHTLGCHSAVGRRSRRFGEHRAVRCCRDQAWLKFVPSPISFGVYRVASWGDQRGGGGQNRRGDCIAERCAGRARGRSASPDSLQRFQQIRIPASGYVGALVHPCGRRRPANDSEPSDN